MAGIADTQAHEPTRPDTCDPPSNEASASITDESISSVPLAAIASRALTAEFTSTCSIRPRSATIVVD